jgi:hypothetical protein
MAKALVIPTEVEGSAVALQTPRIENPNLRCFIDYSWIVAKQEVSNKKLLVEEHGMALLPM